MIYDNEHLDSYLLSLSYVAKNTYSNLDVETLIQFIKSFKSDLLLNESQIKQYLYDALLTKFTDDETSLINNFMSLYNGQFLYLNYESVIHNLSELINKDTEFVKLAFCVDLYYYNFNDENYGTSLKYLFRNNNNFKYKKDYKELLNVINSVHSDYYEDFCFDYIKDNVLLDILDSMQIETIHDFLKLNDDIKYILLIKNKEENIKIFNNLKKHKTDNISELINTINLIKNYAYKRPIDEFVFKLRYGIECKKHTLEEVAKKYGVTRERIRQIETKCILKTQGKYLEKFNKVLQKTIDSLNLNIEYLDGEKVRKYIDNKEIYDLLIAFMKIFCSVIKYDEGYDIFYYEENLDNLLKNKEMLLPELIYESELSSFDHLEQCIIKTKKYYHKTKFNAYLKVNIKTNDLYSLVIDEEYPDGFKINNEFVSHINNIMNEKYGIEPINIRKLYGIISKLDYCNIDFGVLKNRKYVLPLTEDLKIRILDYIENNTTDIVYYKSIYVNFTKELNDIGISNRYYLKGLIDIELPKSYITQKDYISTGGEFKTALESINDEISKFDGYIDFDVLRNQFPGVEDYTFINQCLKRNDILYSDYGKKFYKINYELIKPEFNNTIINEIEQLFSNLKTNVITSSKLYSRMIMFHSDLMNDYQFLNNHFIFFSYVSKSILDYYYRRPYISNDETLDLSCDGIISNYVKNVEYFNNKLIQSYCTKMHLRPLDSYLDFMINESNDFIQINLDTCIKKDSVKINESCINNICNEIDFYINSFGPINTKDSFSFDEFPNIGYTWNKYLLVGFIRSFLNEKYFIEYTDNSHLKTEFIIRRLINGR